MLADWHVGQVLWSIIWLALFFIWIFLLLRVFGDIFRSHDLGGVAKALWVIFVIVLPYLGVLVYLIARGNQMAQHEMQAAQARDAAMRSYIRDAAGGTGSHADELERLASLRDRGVLTDEEFAAQKAKLLG
ncbi:MAG: SHOCT domain-containing protein [Acidimicrobiia bacterium]